MLWSRRCRFVLSAAAIGLAGASLFAADVSWTNPAGGSFADSGNWSGGPPNAADTAVFNLGTGGYTVTFSANVNNQQLRVGNDNVTLDLNTRQYNITTGGAAYTLQVGTASGQTGRLAITGGTLTVNNSVFGNAAGAVGHGTINTGARWTNNGSLTLGESGSGNLTVHGTMTAGQTRIGRQATATGTLAVDGASALFDTPGALIGSIGNGTLLIRNGGTFRDHDPGSFIGAFGGNGFASITGANSLWQSDFGTYIGQQSPATLSISSAARFVQTGSPFSTALGVLAGATGTLLINGGGMNLAAQLSVGNEGSGSVSVIGGGTIISAKAASDTHGFIGEGTNAIGSVSLSGAGSNWTGNGALAVGYLGRGTITIADGATVNSVQGHVARYFSGRGFARVQTGGRWTATNGIFVGGDHTEQGGLATLSFANAGRVEAGSMLKARQAGTILWQSGGELETSAVELLGFMSMSPGRDKVLAVATLSIETATGGVLDLTDNAAVVDYAGPNPAADIRADIIEGRAGGAWTGPGIRSATAAGSASLAVGYAESPDVFASFPATFLGQTIDNTTVLIRTTLLGDANLDGTVNIGDFSQLAASFNLATNKWAKGDFNYDGTTNIGDFSLLASNFNLTLAAPTAGREVLPAAVPEPASCLGVVLAGAMTLTRRGRAQRRPG